MPSTCRAKRIITLNRTGMDDCHSGDFDSALEKLTQALKEVRKMGLECYQVKILNNLGIVFELQGNTQKAKDHYQAAHGIALQKLGGDAVLSQVVGRNLVRVS
jgi:tetratricopeptide (TPR) repeat protein